MDKVLSGLDAFDSEVTPEPSRSLPPAGAGVLMSVVDASLGKNSYAGGSRRARHFERTLTVGRLCVAILRATRQVAFFPFLVVGWFLLRIWWLVRLLVTTAWHALVCAPVNAVRFVITAVNAMLTPPAPLRESPPVVRVAIAGVPAWARDVPLVPAIAFVLTATAGISVAVSLLLLRF